MGVAWLLAGKLTESALVLILVAYHLGHLAEDFLVGDSVIGDKGSQSLSEL